MDRTLRERKPKIRVLIITIHNILCESLGTMVESNGDMCVAGCTSEPDQLSDFNDFDKPNIALIYLSEKGDQTVEIIPRLLKIDPQIRIVAVVGAADVESQTRALQLGAVGIVQKEQNSKLLIGAIRQVHGGETWINQSLLTNLLNNNRQKNKAMDSYESPNVESLTTREKEVIEMIGKGLKNKEIAKYLFISEATVRHHLSSIYGKLYVMDRLNLVIYAYQHNLIQSPQQAVLL